MPPPAPVWMPQSEQGVVGGGAGQKSHRGHRSQHTSHHQTCTQRAAWGYSATQCPGQKVKAREGPCGPCVLRPLLSEQLSEAPSSRGAPLPPFPEVRGLHPPPLPGLARPHLLPAS